MGKKSTRQPGAAAMSESILNAFIALVQNYRNGEMSVEYFDKEADSLLGSLGPGSSEVRQKLMESIRELNLSPSISDHLFAKLGVNRAESAHPAIENRLVIQAGGGQKEVLEAVSIDPANTALNFIREDTELLQKLKRQEAGSKRKLIHPNEVIGGIYRLLIKLGQGSTGEVWKAVDLVRESRDNQDSFVAIRIFKPEISGNLNAMKPLVRDFNRYKKLSHPNLVQVFDLDRDEDVIFMATEYIPYKSLSLFIFEHPSGVSLSEAKPIINGICDGLAYAHSKGLIYEDFNPNQVFYNPQSQEIKLIDFGLSRLIDRMSSADEGYGRMIVQSRNLAYSSPELLANLDSDASDDVYSVSCVIYELLSGIHPFHRVDAVNADQQGLRPAPINELDSNQVEALKRGLEFHRHSRTKSVEQLYRELFSGTGIVKWSVFRNIVAVAVFLILVVLVPLLYQGSGQWRLQQVAEGIQRMDSVSVDKFQSLDLKSQMALLIHEATRTSLVKYYIESETPEQNVLDRILELKPVVQSSLFQTRDVKNLLVSHSAVLIKKAIEKDRFAVAVKIADQLASQYPESRQLSAQSVSVMADRNKRLRELTDTFDGCLDDTQSPLPELLPCFKESAEHLMRIDPSIQIMKDPKLTARFVQEVSVALMDYDLETAQTLLSAWHEINPSELAVRTELSQQWQAKNEIAKMAKSLLNAAGSQMENLSSELAGRDEDFRMAVLEVPRVWAVLMSWYQESVLAFQDSGKLGEAEKLLQEAARVFAGNTTGQARIHRLEEQLAEIRNKKIKALSDLYWSLLEQEEPETHALQTLVEKIKLFDPDNSLLDYPKVPEIFSKRIREAIEREQFERAGRELESWRRLRPGDTESVSYSELRKLRESRMKSAQNRDHLIERIKAQVANGRIEAVVTELENLGESAKTDDFKSVEQSIKTSVIEKLPGLVESEIKKGEFARANSLLKRSLKIFPDEKSLNALGQRIEQAKSEEILKLAMDYDGLLKNQTPQGKVIFQTLESINRLDDQYLVTHGQLFRDLAERLKVLMDNNQSPSVLRELFDEWRNFLVKVETLKEAREIYDSVRDFIALRCLFRAKILKNQAEESKAQEYVGLGLALDPSKNISDVLNRELSLLKKS